MRPASRSPFLLTLALASAACGSDPVEVAPPTMAEVAGTYTATELTGGGYDVIALGGSLELTLGADGSVAGTLYIPPAAAGPPHRGHGRHLHAQRR